MIIKALSIRQPWAWLVAKGHKAVENRDWRTHYRGPFLIHASAGMTRQEYEDVQNFLIDEIDFDKLPNLPPYPMAAHRGGFVGIADLTHVVHERDKHLLTARDKPWFFGEYGFILENVRPLPFVAAKGKLGLFDVELTPELSEAIRNA